MFLFDWVFDILDKKSGKEYEYIKHYLDRRKD
jgi:hypothetical protein